jgi:NifU-like protein involved in Fe-S cluster formation
MYNEKVMDVFKNPKNVGEIENADGVGLVGNESCGDIMQIFLKIENNIIVDAKFKTFGCAAAIATSSMATEMIKGKSIKEALQITNKAVVYNKVKDKNSSNNWDNATIKVAEPIPNPPEPNKVNLSLKTGNPLVVLLIAFITIFGGFGLRCRKE